MIYPMFRRDRQQGFTVIELIVVIVVIGIIAAIGIVGYGAWQRNISESETISDLQSAASAMESSRNFDNTYPTSVPGSFVSSEGVTITGGSEFDGRDFCLQGTNSANPGVTFFIDNYVDKPEEGTCSTRPAIWTSVSRNGAGACGVSRARVYCWGYSTHIGTDAGTSSLVPVAVSTAGVLSGKKVTQVTTGREHACALAEGKAYCWGVNTSGQLGDGSFTNRPQPVAVNTSGALSGLKIDKIDAGGDNTCAIANNRIYCWGVDTYGNLGNGSPLANASVPSITFNPSDMNGHRYTYLDVGYHSTCALASSPSQVYCWGLVTGNGSSGTSSPVALNMTGVLSGLSVTHISVGSQYVCAIASKRAYCWGNANGNTYGQIGNQTTVAQNTPIAVTTTGLLSGVDLEQASTGFDHTCVMSLSKDVYCWGRNNLGQFGNGNRTNSNVAVQVLKNGTDLENESLISLTQSDVFSNGVCGITNTARLICWGDYQGGILGNGISPTVSAVNAGLGTRATYVLSPSL